jgi:hypothetical protein
VRPGRGTAATLAFGAAVAAGCGLGPGEEEGRAELLVTSDHGREVLLTATPELRETDTVLRILDREAEIETRYGGGFVQSIDGLASGERQGRPHDWFFFVNGIESPRGSGEVDLRDGDRVWWDHRDWGSVMRVPAVVGSWPEPFVNGFPGERWTVEVTCLAASRSCAAVEQALAAEGVEAERGEAADRPNPDVARLLVGAWRRLEGDPVAGLLGQSPAESGVFARFREDPRPGLELLDGRGGVSEILPPGGGLVAALRPGEAAPTWVVTGIGARGVATAAALLDQGMLRARYAVAGSPDAAPTALPVP